LRPTPWLSPHVEAGARIEQKHRHFDEGRPNPDPGKQTQGISNWPADLNHDKARKKIAVVVQANQVGASQIKALKTKDGIRHAVVAKRAPH
jgi:hypothetical protein